MSLRLDAIVEALGGELRGNGDLVIERLAPLSSAGVDALTFLGQTRLIRMLAGSRAGCVVVAPDLAEQVAPGSACIVTPDPNVYFAQLTHLWKRHHAEDDSPRIDPTAVVHPTAQLHPSVRIGPLCVIERGVQIGAETVLESRVTVGHASIIGERCLIHSGAVIGSDGFGLVPHEGGWLKVGQLGTVRIGHDVEIGANTCIDRGALDDTVIENGVKLDNLVQIGHNVRIGRNTAMAGCVGVAGSATIGANCTIGGGAGISGHLELVDGVHISAFSVVSRSLRRPGRYTGVFPIDDNAAWEKNAATVRQLHTLRERVRALEKTLGPDKK